MKKLLVIFGLIFIIVGIIEVVHQPSAVQAQVVTGNMQMAMGQLSSAQVLAGSPVTIIAAQGAGTIIIIDNGSFELVFNSVAYSGTSGFVLRYNGSSTATASTLCSATWLTSVASSVCLVSINIGATNGIASTLALNEPAQVTFTATDTLGNSPINYWIMYHVISGF
jgi:hypothetical protein